MYLRIGFGAIFQTEKNPETFIPNFRTPNVLFILECLNIWSNYGNVVRELGLKPYLAHNNQINKLSRYLTISDFYLHFYFLILLLKSYIWNYVKEHVYVPAIPPPHYVVSEIPSFLVRHGLHSCVF